MPWLICPFHIRDGHDRGTWNVGTCVEFVEEDLLSPLFNRYRFPDGSVHTVPTDSVTDVLDNNLALYLLGVINTAPDYTPGQQLTPYDPQALRRFLKQLKRESVDIDARMRSLHMK